jgi:two-component sensor histidine kinase
MMKIVMVDDSAADRRLCRELLKESHASPLEFFEASNAVQGLETCARESPDCVLLDYKLPDMTGLEFLGQLCPEESVAAPKVAVVMLTGVASEQVAVKAMRAGAQDYLLKDRISAEGLSMAVRKSTEKVSLIRALREGKDRLERSVAEKEVLIQEVHHRVKNNLAVIASLLRLQSTTLSDERLATALRESQNRVESMALIHEQLYANGNLREIDLAKHASLLANNLFHSYGVEPGRITFQVSIEPSIELLVKPMMLGVDQAIPAGLILNELLSNALKHAFPRGRRGSVAIEVKRRHGLIELSVQDDGIGVPPDVELARPNSLGMQIIKILTRQLKGSFQLVCGHPATFRITFPEADIGTKVQSVVSGR